MLNIFFQLKADLANSIQMGNKIKVSKVYLLGVTRTRKGSIFNCTASHIFIYILMKTIQYIKQLFKRLHFRSETIVWQLREHTILVEDPSSIPSTHAWLITSWNSSSRESDVLFWLPWTLDSPAQTHTYPPTHSPPHTPNLKIKLNKTLTG